MGNDVQLMDLESYETFELPMPDELKDKIAEGVEVDYIEAMGKQKIMRVK